MKIALVGYGKMGRMIETLAPAQGLEVAARFDIDDPLKDDQATQDRLRDVPVLVEFSMPDQVLNNIRLGLSLKKRLVVGTTGWHDHLENVRKQVKDADTGLVYASNFSLGVNLFYEIVQHAGQMISRFESYDPFLQESHHQFKKDAPSGTALVIKELIQSYYTGDIPVSCVRAGYIPGTHSVGFDSRVDTIRMEHTARNREGFAEGALVAAKWISGHQGCHDFREVLKDILSNK